MENKISGGSTSADKLKRCCDMHQLPKIVPDPPWNMKKPFVISMTQLKENRLNHLQVLNNSRFKGFLYLELIMITFTLKTFEIEEDADGPVIY